MIGLLEGMFTNQVKVGQASASQAIGSAADDAQGQAAPTEKSASEEGFLSMLYQLLVAPMAGQLPPTASSQEQTPQSTPVAQTAIPALQVQQAATGFFVSQPLLDQPSHDRFHEKGEDSARLPLSLMKPVQPEEWYGTSDQEVSVNGSISLQTNERSAVTTKPELEIGNSTGTVSGEPLTVKQLEAPTTTSTSAEAEQGRQDLRPASTVHEAGQQKSASHQAGVRSLEALHSKGEVRIGVFETSRQDLAHAATGSATTPTAMAELKSVAEKFSVVLPYTAATKAAEKPKATEFDTNRIESGQQIVGTQLIVKDTIPGNNVKLAEPAPPQAQQQSDNSLAKQDEKKDENPDQNLSDSSGGGSERALQKNVTSNKAAVEIDNAGNVLRGTTMKPVVADTQLGSVQLKSDIAVPVQVGTRVPLNQPALPDDFAKNLMVKISDEVKLQIEGKMSEVRVMMKPESLGELSLSVTMHEGKLVALMDVTQSAVKNALEAQLPQMREALASQGIEIHRFEIVSGSETQFQRQSEGSAFRQQHRSRRQMDVEVIEDPDGMKYLGYNTVEYII